MIRLQGRSAAGFAVYYSGLAILIVVLSWGQLATAETLVRVSSQSLDAHQANLMRHERRSSDSESARMQSHAALELEEETASEGPRGGTGLADSHDKNENGDGDEDEEAAIQEQEHEQELEEEEGKKGGNQKEKQDTKLEHGLHRSMEDQQAEEADEEGGVDADADAAEGEEDFDFDFEADASSLLESEEDVASERAAMQSEADKEGDPKLAEGKHLEAIGEGEDDGPYEKSKGHCSHRRRRVGWRDNPKPPYPNARRRTRRRRCSTHHDCSFFGGSLETQRSWCVSNF
mmetsp:Transcript_47534/g.101695  ORF Transcript_47534/g.101695 Transcript_47534/m.101695 type:complete len:289 (+) Transcript_47534:63-929(+)